MSTFTELRAVRDKAMGASLGVARCASYLFLLVLGALPLTSRADTVASLLGDFTINQYCGLTLEHDTVNVHLAIVFGQLPALRELHEADTNGDGVTTQAERDAYVSTLAPGFAERLELKVDGANVPLRASSWTSSLPKEASGFSMRIDIDYSGNLPKVSGQSVRTLTFQNKNFPGRIGWHEVSVVPEPGLGVFDTNAFSTSLTGGLTEALQALPASGPLDERAIHLSFTSGAVPTGSTMLARRDGTQAMVAQTSPPGSTEAGWLAEQTRRLIGLISAPQVPLHVTLFALLAALALGAMHALSPGHGKSIVGAYLVGSRGTPRHAVFLGMTVTVTHTLVVFALGLVTLFASRFILPERIFPVLSLLSGLLVLGMGLVLLVQRWKAARSAWIWGFPGASNAGLRPALAAQGGYADHAHEQPHTHIHAGQAHTHGAGTGGSAGHAHGHSHASDHGHGHDHDGHSHDPRAGLMHTHGGSMHSHLPPGGDFEAVTWRGLLALGVSGGLLPCPSAMVLLLAAVALNKTLFGLVLVLAFSVGLAMTLIGVGMAFLYARNRFQSRLTSSRWTPLLPVLSAASITVLGALLCVGTLTASPL